MSRWIGVLIVGVVLVLSVGLGIQSIQRSRVQAEVLRCQNHLRGIALFAAEGEKGGEAARAGIAEIPAGTVVSSAQVVEERLSWYATALTWLNASDLSANDLLNRLDRHQRWDGGGNAAVARVRLPGLVCPADSSALLGPGESPAVTSYFGTAGLGLDAAELSLRRVHLDLGNFGQWRLWLVSPRAGCFRYDAPTPLDAITDGLAQTILLGERRPAPGPWLQGGPATVRGYDTRPDAPPPIGLNSQFGGNHPQSANFAYADGHVAPITARIDPRILMSQLTIQGGAAITE